MGRRFGTQYDFSMNSVNVTICSTGIEPRLTVFMCCSASVTILAGNGQPVKFRVTFSAFDGKHFDQETKASVVSDVSAVMGSSRANMTGMIFHRLPGFVDVSTAKVVFYGDVRSAISF